MSKIAIVTGSSASLPYEIRQDKQNGIFNVPFIINTDDEKLFDDDLYRSEEDKQTFIDLLSSRHKISTTQPSQETYIKAIEDAKKWGAEEIIFPAIISPELSGAYNAIRSVVGENPAENFGVPIWLPERATKVSMAEGLDVLKALRLRERGLGAKAIMETIDREYDDNGMAQIFTSFKQLRKNGRIGRAKSLVAGAMGIKGVVSLDLNIGDLNKVGQARKWSEVYEIAIKHIASTVGKRAVRVAFTHFEIDEKYIEQFKENVFSKLNVREEGPTCEQSYVLSGHTDIGTLAAFAEIIH